MSIAQLSERFLSHLGMIDEESEYLMGDRELFSDSTCEEQTHLAERELASFLSAVTELYGREQADLSAKEWLDESDSMDTSCFSIKRDWRAVTIAASARLAKRLSADSNQKHSAVVVSSERKMIRSRETGSYEVIWSAIHYLDPDLENKRSDKAVIFSMLCAALLIGTILILLKLRGL